MFVRAGDGALIPISLYFPEGETKAWLHILHGMGEHRRRYVGLIRQLLEAGYFVSIQNHRGHGETAISLGDFGSSGWPSLVSDARDVLAKVVGQTPSTNLILFGHSMGTLVAQQLLQAAMPESIRLRGLVLSGHPGRVPKLLVHLLMALIKLERARLSGDQVSRLLRYLVFGRSNSGFGKEMPRSGFEWLSKDTERVRDYVADPFCGHFVTIDSLESMMRADLGFWEAGAPLGAGLPVYFVSGAQDPLHAGQRLLTPVMQAFQAAGWQLSADIYPGGRHEMFQETNREDVINRLLMIMDAW